MPVYEFECREHGTFDEIRPFSASSDPAACPTCGGRAERIMSLPQLAVLDHHTRVALGRNEKSRHEPEVHRGRLDQHRRFHVHRKGARDGCGAGCGHDHGAPAKKASDVLHQYKGPRPWVMEHGPGSD